MPEERSLTAEDTQSKSGKYLTFVLAAASSTRECQEFTPEGESSAEEREKANV